MDTNGLRIPIPTSGAPSIKVNSFVLRLALHKEFLRKKHGMTAEEVAICLNLAAGHSIATIARMRDVSKNTVRSQISAILSRTHTARQAELVAFLACIAIDGK
jgi:DNA-binding NarL/FixJ family response regulator